MKWTRILLLPVLLVILWAPAFAQTNPASGKAATKAPASKSAVIDINTASEAELKQLPGIGDAYAAKIVRNRPYRAKNQLVQKKIIPQATYDKIKDQIIAKQSASTPAK